MIHVQGVVAAMLSPAGAESAWDPNGSKPRGGDVDSAYAQLQAKGLPVEKPVTPPYGMKQLWLTDPDGFRLCFQSPAA